MTTRTTPPFRADHVGSFLRPKALLDARDRYKRAEIDRDALRTVENEAIRNIVRFQEDLGLQGITDGEFRRTYFHIDFLEQLEGVEIKGGIAVSFHSKSGNVDFSPPVMRIVDKVRHEKPIQLADFEYLKSVTTRVPKVTIPSPTMLQASHRRRREVHAARADGLVPAMRVFEHGARQCHYRRSAAREARAGGRDRERRVG